jgi:hypothetical protein
MLQLRSRNACCCEHVEEHHVNMMNGVACAFLCYPCNLGIQDCGMMWIVAI